MHLIIDGYNLLHADRSLITPNDLQLQRERDRLIDQLSTYQQRKSFGMTVVFDGWLGGRTTEKRERKKGVEVVFSKLGEKADEVIKRMIREKGSGAIVISSDREIIGFAQRMAVSVISSEQFREKLEIPFNTGKEVFIEEEEEEEEERRGKKKGLARRLSKKEKRARAALRKL
ncbi:MAG: NYN domain-containing protein [Syntrophaceae bacterium]|nr:NYN domain-containing protein [Syntrophaceae bacterium]